ncbi:MAG: peptidylprolyl isomerase [Pseudomonadota bacterium]|nr:peptidylprolyl isomerase [Pseudomonadota bacterium]
MKIYTRKIFFIRNFILLLITFSVQAQNLDLSDTGKRLDGIAAIVNDGLVLLSELEEQTMVIAERLRDSNTPMPPQNILIEQILERLIIEQIQLQRAERYGMQISDEGLNRTLAGIAQRNNTTLANLPQLLIADGIDYLAFRENMRKQMIIEQLRQRDVISRINVSPRELEEYLKREENSEYRNLNYKISHILIAIPTSPSPNAIQIANKRAEDIYSEILSGEDFAKLAVTYSDAENALEGGDLGWRNGDSIPSLFAKVLPNMKAGEISKPFRSPSGFHLIKVQDIEGNKPIIESQMLARHILLKTNEILDDDNIRQKLDQIRNGILGGDEFDAIAKAISEDPASAINGGNLGWSGPGAFVAEFETVLNSLDINEISKPFQSPYGWHIVQLLKKRMHDKTQDVKRQNAMLSIRDGKIAEETELWLRQMRDESFVEYRL